MKKVLIITNYFPPEMGAASNRIYQLADALSDAYEVSILCPLPNYPKGEIFDSYKGKWFQKDTIDGITVNRLWIYASNSRHKFLRLLAMLSFSFSLVWYFVKHKIPKTVIIQSPPLLVAFTALLFLSKTKHQLILNVSDLWPSAGLELGAFKKGIGYRFLKSIEAYNYKKAELVLGQSEEILNHISLITKAPKLKLFRNYPDFEPPIVKNIDKKEGESIKLVYAGLLGVAQGILKLCKTLDYSNIEFHIYGSGLEEKAIVEFIKKHKDLPITYHGSIARKKLHRELLTYDLAIIPLLQRIYGSVPSKIFEYSRLGLPLLYFGGGEGESIIKKYDLGWVAKAGDYKALNTTLNNVTKDDLSTMVRQKIQDDAIAYFDYKRQLNNLKQDL